MDLPQQLAQLKMKMLMMVMLLGHIGQILLHKKYLYALIHLLVLQFGKILVTGFILAGQIAYSTVDNSIIGSDKFLFDGSELHLNVTGYVLPTDPFTPVIHIAQANGNNENTTILLDAYTGTGGGNSRIIGRSARGTVSIPSAVKSGDELFCLEAAAFGSTQFSNPAAEIKIHAAEDWTDTAQGTRVSILLTDPGTNTMVERARFWGDGGLTIGEDPAISHGAGTLAIAGIGTLPSYPTMKFVLFDTVDSYLQANIQNLSDGTEASSDIALTNDIGNDSSYYVDLGINSSNYSHPTWTLFEPNSAYLYSNDSTLYIGTSAVAQDVVIFTGGVTASNVRVRFSDTGIIMTPAVSAAGGAEGFTFVGAANTNTPASSEYHDVHFDLSRDIQWETGALTTQRAMLIDAPTYSFIAASTITNAATLAIGNAPIAGPNCTITNRYALWIQSGSLAIHAGTAGLPSYIFENDPSTGIYSPATNSIGFTTDGVLRFTISDISITCLLPINGSDGVVNDPSFSFASNTTSGMYLISSNKIGFSVDGILVVAIRDISTQTSANFELTPNAHATGSSCAFRLVTPADTNMTLSTESSSFIIDLSTSRQWATGALTTQRAVRITAPTYAFVGASVITDAATVSIAGAPIAGTNATITNPIALWIESGVLACAASSTAAASLRLPHGVDPTSPINGDAWTRTTDLSVRLSGTTLRISSDNLSHVLFSQTQTVTFSGTATTSMLGTGVGSVIIPANYLTAGRKIKVKALFNSTRPSSGYTLVITVTFGTYTATLTATSLSGNNSHIFDAEFVPQAAGASVTIVGTARNTTSASSMQHTVGTAAAFDTTVATTLVLTGSVNNVAASISCHSVTIESLPF